MSRICIFTVMSLLKHLLKPVQYTIIITGIRPPTPHSSALTIGI